MEALDEISLVSIRFLFWNPFGNQVCIIIYAEDRIVRRQLAEDPMVVDFINSYPTTFTFITDLCLFSKCLDKIFNMSLLVDENIVSLLDILVSYCLLLCGGSVLTAFVMPSLSHVTLTLFFMSSSARLMSKTS